MKAQRAASAAAPNQVVARAREVLNTPGYSPVRSVPGSQLWATTNAHHALSYPVFFGGLPSAFRCPAALSGGSPSQAHSTPFLVRQAPGR